ncbi:MAG: hypothetical protein RLN94_15050 [Roseovarius sp.]|uniref:2-keto-4-pentenoate hydratase n=1 Tax=Roseovarius sp. TaxID=1486281 RepID=UPI0032EF28D4
MTQNPDAPGLAAALLEAYDSGRPLAPLSGRIQGFDAATAGRVAHHITATRTARGERMVGRKIGFTNRSIWPIYGVTGPIWGPVWNTTLFELSSAPVTLPNLPEPRLEPEIILGLKSAPSPGMTPDDLAHCIDWVSHGFEIVFSPFPGWTFDVTDCQAGFGLHGALFTGPRLPLSPERAAALPGLSITLEGPGGKRLTGRGADVLDGPLHALAYLLDTLAADPQATPLAAGEIITTGTLTDAVPLSPGDTWQTRLDGIDLPGAKITFR